MGVFRFAFFFPPQRNFKITFSYVLSFPVLQLSFHSLPSIAELIVYSRIFFNAKLFKEKYFAFVGWKTKIEISMAKKSAPA